MINFYVLLLHWPKYQVSIAWITRTSLLFPQKITAFIGLFKANKLLLIFGTNYLLFIDYQLLTQEIKNQENNLMK